MNPGLVDRLRAARARSDALFATLQPEAWLERPVAERHRLLFYLGHLEAFDWNLLVRAPSRHAGFEKLFAFGIDPLDELPRDTPAQWPPLAAVRAWMAQARADVDARLQAAPVPPRLALVALEHRLMHVETLSYLFEQLAPGLRTLPAPRVLDGPVAPQRWLAVPTGPVQLGLARASAPAAGWCNEYEAHTVQPPAFEIEARKTTNADWLGFVEAGGYRERRLWSAADWAWLEQQRITAPPRWAFSPSAGWTLRTGGTELPLPLSWPVYVSHAEAGAYARWRGARLPGEAEWQRAVHGTPAGGMRAHPWGEAVPQGGVHGNFDFHAGTPTPVGAHPQGASAFGLDEPVGNGWEWTASPFAPFPGFEPFEDYPGYSAPFFDGRHFVLCGASAVTAAPLLRRTFRNWYQPHYRAAFATVRLARGGGATA